MEGAIVVLVIFGSLLAAFYIYYSTRHRERLALIEKGADASLFNTGRQAGERSGKLIGMLTLKAGLFLMGIAIGIITGGILTNIGVLNEGANYTSMIFFFGGLSLVVSYLIGRKQ